MKLKRKTIFFIILLWLVITFFNLFPHYYAYIHTPNDQVFSGQASWFDPWDINAYVAAIRYGQKGHFFLPNLYVSDPNSPIFIHQTYTLLGLLFRQMNPFLLFHLASAFTSLLLIFTIYFILTQIYHIHKHSLSLLFFICLGGGLGFIFYPKFSSADIAVTGYTLASAWQRPHEAIFLIFHFLSVAYLFQLFSTKKNNKKIAIKTSIYLAIATIYYPYEILLYTGTTLILWFIYDKFEKTNFNNRLILIFLPSLLIITLIYFNFQSNPAFAGIFNQKLSSVKFINMLLGFGLLLAIAIYKFQKTKLTKFDQFLFYSLICQILLSFLPLGISKFFFRGSFFFLTIFTLPYIFSFFHTRYHPYLFVLTTILTCSSFFTIFFLRLQAIQESHRWIFLTQTEKNIFNYLQKKQDNKAVLTLSFIGNLTPAHTGKPVFLGHHLQTPDFDSKIDQAISFFRQNLTDSQALEFLIQNHITWIILDKEVQELNIDKLDYDFLQTIILEPDTSLYQVRS